MSTLKSRLVKGIIQLSHHAGRGVGKIKIRIAERLQDWDNERYDMSGL